MGGPIRYFREHRWQRRAITGLLAFVAGTLLALLLYPVVRDYRLIKKMGSEDDAVRTAAILRAVSLARASKATLQRLNDALATRNDTQFAAIAAALLALDQFDTPRRDPLQIDRLRAIQVAEHGDDGAGAAAEVRRTVLVEIILSGRSNPHVLRALAAASSDPSVAVRELAGVLAGQVGDAQALDRLLADSDTTVASAAALCSGLTGPETSPAAKLLSMMDRADDVEAVSAAAYALARTRPAESSPRLCRLLRETDDARLRDRLLHAAIFLNDDLARQTVRGILERNRKAELYPPAMALLAAGRLDLAAAETDIRQTLTGRRGKGELLEAHLLAALRAAELLNLRHRAEAEMLCRKLWRPGRPLTLMAAARALGRELDSAQPPGEAPSWAQCIETLRAASAFSARPTSGPAVAPQTAATTPLPSAAAAVALWLAGTAEAEHEVRDAAAGQTTLPGDYAAWHIGRSGMAGAFELGLTMLPALDAPTELRVYNDNERAAGAILLALSAGTPQQRALAAERVLSRLEGGPLGGEDDFYVIGAYHCALLMLGKEDSAPFVRELQGKRAFPRRRVFTAHCAVGDRQGLDWLLWKRRIPRQDIAYLLAVRGLGEVIAVMAPQMPAMDIAGDDDLRLWQVRIMQYYWGIHRRSIRLGVSP